VPSSLRQGFGDRLDEFLLGLSLYAVPALLAAVTLISLLAWRPEYTPTGEEPLSLRVYEASGTLTPRHALEHVAPQRLVPHHDTRLSEEPFWYAFELPRTAAARLAAVELPSRHATHVACWDASTLDLLGTADRGGSASGAMRAIKAGFMIDGSGFKPGMKILCRSSFVGPARLSVLYWPQAQLEVSSEKFHRNTGLLDGGLLVLALFVLVTAVINREWVYVLFAAWLVASLRLAAISAGFDTQWFERAVPTAWLLPMRQLTIASCYVLTWALFSRLLRDELAAVGYAPLTRLAQLSCVAMLVFAVALPYAIFLPVMWITVSGGVLLLAFYLARILLLQWSMVAVWYAGSLAINFAANLYEVVAAAAGYKVFIGTVNSVTAALASSLMAAFAIAEQIRQERQQRLRAQAELRHAYEVIPIGLFTLDSEGRFAQSNPALRAMLGVRGSELAPWRDYFQPGAWPLLQDLVATDSATHEMQLRGAARPGAEPKVFLVKAALASGRIEGSLQDITATVQATERLRFFADHDPLTGILNRRGIEQALDRMTSADRARPFALAYLDLDRFKLINDLYCHPAGDQVLKQVCERVQGVLGPGHELGRVGGDEFVIVFADTPISAATRLCQQITEAVGGAPYRLEERAFQVRVSIGLVEVPAGVAVKDVLAVADRACREVKAGHHANPAVYLQDAAVFREQTEELRLVERFGTQVAPEGLFLAMQPIMSMRAPQDSLDFEALLRMREPDGSVTLAGPIIAAAESNGRVSVIDRWVLENLLQWLAAHDRHLARTRFVCVNFSGGSLNDERFVQDAFAMLAGSGRLAQRLCIEITESVALHDLANTRRFIDRVRSFGAKIALDDFGAGYTSFSYLKELPADAVKIAGNFVRGVSVHPANLAIVEAITELVRNLGMKSVAEWVEDSDTVEVLAQVGVDYVQGYAIGRPQPASKILVADSAAAFIEDQDVARFVRDALGGDWTGPLPEAVAIPLRKSLATS
jgi:diguanylate cyclase (GGDEF)-like protein